MSRLHHLASGRITQLALLAIMVGLSSPGWAEDQPHPVRVVRLDGATETVELKGINSDGQVVLANGTTIPRDDLRQIISLHKPASNREAVDGRMEAHELFLAGGSRLFVRDVTLKNDVCRATRTDREEAFWSFPVDDLRAVRFDPSRKLSSFDAAVAQPDKSKDRFFVSLDGEITTLDGFLSAIDSKGVSFEWMKEERVVPLEKLFGLVLAAPSGDKRPPARWRIVMRDRSQVFTPTLEMTQTEADAADAPRGLIARLTPKTSIDFPWTAVERIEVRSDRLRPLSEMPPSSVTETPLAALPRPWRANRSVTGHPLRIGDQTYESGFGVQSGSRLVFDLDGSWSEFTVVIGLDPHSGRDGDCEFVVKVDGREVARQRMRGQDTSKPLRIPLNKATRLELAVEYGAGFDLNDHANWCDPLLIRSP